MNEKKCKKFLMQIFFQCVMSDSFFDLVRKIGINFETWPNIPEFDTAKKFYSLAIKKSWTTATFEMPIESPEMNTGEIVDEYALKNLYTDYLNFLLALELVKNLKRNPENAKTLCENFLKEKTSVVKYENLASATSNFVSHHEEKLKSGELQVVLPRFRELSKTIGGFNPGRVTICTAHSGFGKTNLGVNILEAAMSCGKNTLYVNMEMDSVDMTKRVLQAVCKMTGFEFLNSNYIEKVSNSLNAFSNLNKNWITDGSTMSLSEISQVIFEIKKTQGLDFLVVDYDQKIVMDEYGIDQEWQYVKKAVEILEAIAKREQLHVILFAQTNEESQGAPISSRRSIQPASVVMQFTREGDQPMLKFLKNRHGPTDAKIKLIYDAAKSVIVEDGYVVSDILHPQNNVQSMRGRFS